MCVCAHVCVNVMGFMCDILPCVCVMHERKAECCEPLNGTAVYWVPPHAALEGADLVPAAIKVHF